MADPITTKTNTLLFLKARLKNEEMLERIFPEESHMAEIIKKTKKQIVDMESGDMHAHESAGYGSMYKEEKGGKEYTMDDLVVVVDGKIWDFKTLELSDITMGNLEQCARKLYKVCYFKQHSCDPANIEKHIPAKSVSPVFSDHSWGRISRAAQSELHNRILTTKIVDIILSRWQKQEGYPQKTSTKEERNEAWERLVDGDPSVLKWMVGPMADSVDWDTIEETRTPGAKTLFEWTRGSLVMAAETAFQIGRDRHTENGERGGPVDGARLMNVAWEHLPQTTQWKALLSGVQVPLNPNFGRRKRTAIKTKAKPSLLCLGGVEGEPVSFTKARKRKDYTRAKRKAEEDWGAEDELRSRRRRVGLSEGNLFRRKDK
ncbi:hypothetical protein V494_04033 [Pseudogymnoascus sp. VKM F-4513 (FW-928)]|nr:hypothetical protein V494_04033 [Pseudogymnoascus sp. VKM F-4513 (FW-928)]